MNIQMKRKIKSRDDITYMNNLGLKRMHTFDDHKKVFFTNV